MRRRGHQEHALLGGTPLPGGLTATACALLVLGWFSNQHTNSVVALWLLLLAALVWQANLERGGQTDSNSDFPNGKKLGDVDALFGSFVAAWTLASLSLSLGYVAPTSDAQIPVLASLAINATLLALAVLTFANVRHTVRASDPESGAELQPFVPWIRVTIWIIALAGVVQALIALGMLADDSLAVELLMLFAALPAMEWIVRALAQRGTLPDMLRDGHFVPLLFSDRNPVASAIVYFETRFEISLRDTWSFKVIGRSIQPIACGLLLLGWASTSLATIDTFERGVQERFGRPVSSEALDPGLHLKAPWPIDIIHRFPTTRIEALPLGFAGQKEGVSLLWTKQHAAEEYTLLLGDGRDLVTVNATLNYRISDAVAWHYSTQNPQAALEALAEQALFNNTVSRSLDGVLSENVSQFARRIESEVAKGAERLRLGVTIVGVAFHGIHPPVSVATDYQAVVSAQHERQTLVHKARAYEAETIAGAQSQAEGLLAAAQGSAAARIAKAEGDAEAFNALLPAYVRGPSLYRFRERTAVIEANLEDRSVHIIDDRIERDGGALWFQR